MIPVYGGTLPRVLPEILRYGIPPNCLSSVFRLIAIIMQSKLTIILKQFRIPWKDKNLFSGFLKPVKDHTLFLCLLRWPRQHCGVPDPGGQLRHPRGLRLLQPQAHPGQQDHQGLFATLCCIASLLSAWFSIKGYHRRSQKKKQSVDIH